MVEISLYPVRTYAGAMEKKLKKGDFLVAWNMLQGQMLIHTFFLSFQALGIYNSLNKQIPEISADQTSPESVEDNGSTKANEWFY